MELLHKCCQQRPHGIRHLVANHLGGVSWVLGLTICEQPLHGSNILALSLVIQDVGDFAGTNVFATDTLVNTDIRHSNRPRGIADSHSHVLLVRKNVVTLQARIHLQRRPACSVRLKTNAECLHEKSEYKGSASVHAYTQTYNLLGVCQNSLLDCLSTTHLQERAHVVLALFLYLSRDPTWV